MIQTIHFPRLNGYARAARSKYFHRGTSLLINEDTVSFGLKNNMAKISYKTGSHFDLDSAIELYRISTLGERRPTDNREVMRDMLENADIVITAWHELKLVGIARTLTDFGYVAYLADLAVHVDYQKQGIGKKLIRKTKEQLRPTCFITLLAAPDANEYYSKIGFTHNPRAWVWKPT